MPLELAEPVLRHGVGIGEVASRRLAAQLEGAADPLDIDADHPGSLALASEGGDGQARQVAHLAVRARADRLADPLAQVV